MQAKDIPADLGLIRCRAAVRCGLPAYPARLVRLSDQLDQVTRCDPIRARRQLITAWAVERRKIYGSATEGNR